VQRGRELSKAVSGYPLCCPFRGALISGLYPHKSVPGHEVAMPPELPTVALPFKEAGYHTAWLGKWVSGRFPVTLSRTCQTRHSDTVRHVTVTCLTVFSTGSL
jgi:arylsulfatase A-like enzyme